MQTVFSPQLIALWQDVGATSRMYRCGIVNKWKHKSGIFGCSRIENDPGHVYQTVFRHSYSILSNFQLELKALYASSNRCKFLSVQNYG